MKKLTLIAFLILMALPALCDGTDTLIAWPGWVVSSTEDLYMGHIHTSFPLTYMFDGDAASTWVFSGKGKRIDGSASGYAVTLARGDGAKPITLDSIWIMNGYNKSRELFLRNNRITQLKLYINSKFEKTVTLDDSMGWHKISIPRQPINEIKLVFTGFAKGPDNDVCVSEIALYDQGKMINMKMPKAVEYTEGNGDCGDGQVFYVIDRQGKQIKDFDRQSPCVWSPSGRYIAAAPYLKFWVIDSSTAKVIMQQTLSGDNWTWTEIDRWKDEHNVVITIEKSTPQKTKEGDYKTSYYTKTIKIPN